LGFAPDPTGRAYGAPPDPIVVFRGPILLKGGEGKEGRGRGEEGRKEERERRDGVRPLY